jgi:adenylyltransferase/sulfurtransferase
MNKMNKEQLFKRQITLKEIGNEGQQKLQNAKVLVVGCGGLGSPIAVYLASSGVGELHLVDFDTIDATNLHRQVFYSLEDVGKPKATVLAEFINQRAPFTDITFSNTSITKSNVFQLISEVDIVVDGTDSLPTKYLLNDACVLQQKPLVYGSLYKFDGYVATFNVLQSNGTFSANLRDAFPEMAIDIPNCEEAGTLNAIVGIIAMQQANEVLKLITGVGNLLINQLLIYNSLENSQLKMKLKNTVTKTAIKAIFDKETYADASCETQNSTWLISADALKNELLNSEQSKAVIISVIEDQEINPPFSIDQHIPLSELNTHNFVIEKDKKYVIVCQQGVTSYTATTLLKTRYPKADIVSLSGGLQGFS